MAKKWASKNTGSRNKSTGKIPEEVPPSAYLTVVWEHLTEELCEHVFQAIRTKERVRKWSLYALMRLWVGLIQTDASSQTRAIEQHCGKGHPLFPMVDATPESFFMRIQTMRPEFFRNVFAGFTHAIASKFPRNFQSELPIGTDRFEHIFAIDGSRLAKVGRTLKVARTTVKAIVPGSLEAVYDLRGGYIHELHFDPDGARSELHLFEQVIDSLPAGSLLVNDRYYPKPIVWNELEARDLFMVARYNATVKKRRTKVLRKVRNAKLSIDDWIVEMGGSQHGTQPVQLRWIHLRSPDFDLVLITNVLDSKLLTAEEAALLYRQRWSVERMYLHLKEVLALNRLFNAAPAAIAGQVYATAILYNALRLSQSQLAESIGVAPEDISPDKFIVAALEKFIETTIGACFFEATFEQTQHLNPKVRLKRPTFCPDDFPQLRLKTAGLLRELRDEVRKQRRFCKGRKGWTTYNLIPGAKKLTKLT